MTLSSNALKLGMNLHSDSLNVDAQYTVLQDRMVHQG